MKHLFLCIFIFIFSQCKDDSLEESKSTLYGQFCMSIYQGNPPSGYTIPIETCISSASETGYNFSVVIYDSDKKQKVIAKQSLEKNLNYSFQLTSGSYYIDVIDNVTQKSLKGNSFILSQTYGFPMLVTIDVNMKKKYNMQYIRSSM